MGGKYKLNKPNGITLIALIITIIVMLILVSVSVQILINSNLIGAAEDAANKTKTAYQTEGSLGKDFNPLAKNVNYQLQGVPVISATQLLSLPMLKQVVLMQSYIDRPILADSPRWYLDNKMKKLAKIPPSPNVPDWIVAQREDINDDMLAKLGIEYDPNEENEDGFEADTQ